MPILSKCSPISFSSIEPSWLQTSPWVELRFLESPPNLVLPDMTFGFHFPFKNMLSLCFQYLTRMLNAGFSQSIPAECRHSPPVQPRAPCPAAPHGPPIPPGICSTLGLCQLPLRPGEGEPVGDYWWQIKTWIHSQVLKWPLPEVKAFVAFPVNFELSCLSSSHGLALTFFSLSVTRE